MNDDYVLVPKVPTPAMLQSMALRYRHDFGLIKDESDGPLTSGVTHGERRMILNQMLTLYQEVTGQGFYQHPPVTSEK